MAARGEIRYLGLHQRVSGLCARERIMRIRHLLLCCMQNLSDSGVLPTRRLQTIQNIGKCHEGTGHGLPSLQTP